MRINTYEQCYNSKITDVNGFQRRTPLSRFFNIKKMAANDRKRAMRNGQYWVFKVVNTTRQYLLIIGKQSKDATDCLAFPLVLGDKFFLPH